jgi:hypothetical protein
MTGKDKKLGSGKDQAAKQGGKDQKVGSAKEECPKKKERSLEAEWSAADGFCGDKVFLKGKAKGIEKSVEASASAHADKKSVWTGKAKGQSEFQAEWKVCGVAFPNQGAKTPKELPVEGKLAADGLSAKTPKAFAAKRLPDQKLEAVSFKCSSPKATNGTANYEWTASFQLGVEGTAVQVRQTLQIKKAWLGKWVSFEAADKLKQGWGFVKKTSKGWKYWDTAASKWEKLPRKIGDYTVNDLTFVKSGKDYKSRDDGGTFTWPEKFAEPSNYEKQKKTWLSNIHGVWDKKFRVQQKDCADAAPGLCTWDLDIKVKWGADAGDHLVYAVWSADWERSNAQDWYLSETRVAVAGHECGHLLGAYDEYTGGAIHPTTKKIEKNSIMGQNLTKAEPRHLDDLRQQLEKKVKSWIGRDWKLEIKKR